MNMQFSFSLYRTTRIARKEGLDAFRDRRTLLMIILPALFAGPLFLLLIFNLIASHGAKAQSPRLAVGGGEYAPALIAFLEQQQVRVESLPDDYEIRIRRGEFDIAMIVPPSFPGDVIAGRSAKVQLVYDRSRDRAQITIGQVEQLLRVYGQQWGKTRLILRGVAPDVAAPLSIDAVNLATPQQSGALLLSLISFYALFATLTGGMALALDTSAGERERQSLQPLLITPAQPLEIVGGKWLAASTVNIIVALLTLIGFYLTLRFAPLPAVGIPFLFGLNELLRFCVILLPLAFLLPALHFYVGIRSRSVREAQASTSILLLLFSLLPITQMFLQQREPDWIVAIPIAGHYTMLSRALRGDILVSWDIVLTYTVPFVLLLFILFACARRIDQETRRP
ncbi:MAG: ABC transporter permease [Burkholderiales bacterium]|jgi:sodium transport system permease protein|nr:ABC transporter permease [Burkholderiales bacterium]